jgi:ATP phosphoribosyltransferase regulatory subunit
MQLGNREWPAAGGAILAPEEPDAALAEKVRQLRAQGEVVIQQLPGQQGSCWEMHCNRTLRWDGAAWVVEKI